MIALLIGPCGRTRPYSCFLEIAVRRPLNRRAFERLIRRHPGGLRTSTIRILGGPASRTRSAFSRDEVEFEDETGMNKLQFLESSSCDNGHVLGTANAEIVGTCRVCDRWLCTAPGCAFTCADHGHVVCGRHAFRDGERVLCSDHRFMHNTMAVGRVAFAVVSAILRPVFSVISAILRNYAGVGRDR